MKVTNPIAARKLQKKASTIIGFAGILLGLLVNAIIKFKTEDLGANVTIVQGFTEYHLIELMFLVAVICLTACLIFAFSLALDIPITNKGKSKPEENVKKSSDLFEYGFIISAAIIVEIIFNNYRITLLFFIVLIAILYVYTIKHNLKNITQKNRCDFILHIFYFFSLFYVVSLLYILITVKLFQFWWLSLESLTFLFLLICAIDCMINY